MHRKSEVSLLLLLVFSLPAIAQDSSTNAASAKKQVTFYAMGDVPYSPPEDSLLPLQVANLPADAEFVIHVGDIKGGKPPCDEAVYIKVAGMLGKSTAPVFIIPGDNEWNDCANPVEAWQFWNKHFMKFDRHWKHQLTVSLQAKHEENFSFVRGTVLFVGINIVGGKVVDPEEWKQRHADDLAWTRENLQRFGAEATSLVIFGHARPAPVHNDFFEPLSMIAQEFDKPVLYLHGDGHRWLHDRPFKAKNILRVEVDQGGIAPPVKITITDHPTNPFVFDRRNGKPSS